METTIPSIEELDERLADYAVATKERDTSLVKIFLGIVITAFARKTEKNRNRVREELTLIYGPSNIRNKCSLTRFFCELRR
jgi:hypothetical protein